MGKIITSEGNRKTAPSLWIEIEELGSIHSMICIVFIYWFEFYALYSTHCMICIVWYDSAHCILPMHCFRNVFYVLCSIHCIPCFVLIFCTFQLIVFYALGSIHWIPCIALYALHTIQFVLCMMHAFFSCALHSMYFTLCLASVHFILYIALYKLLSIALYLLGSMYCIIWIVLY